MAHIEWYLSKIGRSQGLLEVLPKDIGTGYRLLLEMLHNKRFHE